MAKRRTTPERRAQRKMLPDAEINEVAGEHLCRGFGTRYVENLVKIQGVSRTLCKVQIDVE